jgi:DNA-binding transcriptional LysR family regulator
LDIGIIGSYEKRPTSPSLAEHNYLKDETVLVVSKDHPWCERNGIDFKELTGQPLILPQKNTLTRRIIEEKFREFSIALNIVYEIRNTEIIKRMVERNLGVSILGLSAVKREVGFGWLKQLSISNLKLPRKINFIYHREKKLSPTLQLFIDHLTTGARRSQSR